jgi:hypothetical protein
LGENLINISLDRWKVLPGEEMLLREKFPICTSQGINPGKLKKLITQGSLLPTESLFPDP